MPARPSPTTAARVALRHALRALGVVGPDVATVLALVTHLAAARAARTASRRSAA